MHFSRGRTRCEDAATLAAIDDRPAAARWRKLVSDRLAEMRRLSPGSGSLSGSFWDGRAERYASQLRVQDAMTDPFLRRLRRVTDASSSAVDVGAGTGRFALALAPAVRQVTAVEPSAAMLAQLRRGAEQLGVGNVHTIQATWEDADVAKVDVAFSAFVVTLVAEAGPFLAKLDAAAREPRPAVSRCLLGRRPASIRCGGISTTPLVLRVRATSTRSPSCASSASSRP